ncbi:MAG: hypothetical protein UMU76_00845 [Prosthecochloris sp.]|nr:hypothetical protein [Prosthecochloris sp.]
MLFFYQLLMQQNPPVFSGGFFVWCPQITLIFTDGFLTVRGLARIFANWFGGFGWRRGDRFRGHSLVGEVRRGRAPLAPAGGCMVVIAEPMGFAFVFLPYLFLVTGHWSLVTGHWSLVTGHWSLVTGHWSPFPCRVQGKRKRLRKFNDSIFSSQRDIDL